MHRISLVNAGIAAAPCLGDVDGFDRETILTYLFAMAVVLCIAAWLLGKLAQRLSRQNAGLEKMLAFPLSWCIVAVVGAAPAISFAIMGNSFPPEVSARANGALNASHFAWAFGAQ
jgi:hypothetical protein